MKTIGLIGGIGSGKSTVAAMFEDLGAATINADEIGHRVLLRDDVKKQAQIRWGGKVFNSLGELDRRRLAEIVFGSSAQNKQELEFLKSITHPLIGQGIEYELRRLEKTACPVVVLDIPLLLEAHWDSSVDKIVFVETSYQTRLKRVETRGWTEDEFQSRENVQMPLDEKRFRADWIIKNDGNFANVLDQVKRIWQNLVIN